MTKKLADILQPVRLRPSKVLPSRSLSEEVLSDSGRIIPSPPFRRLQSKAQVFSLEVNAGVRTRLTHSMEVAVYGRILAGKVFHGLRSKSLIEEGLLVPLVTTVENACLLHDIGNPPFGHFGEFTIRAWFSDENKRGQLANIPEPYLKGLQSFDGNPQGFRILSRLSWAVDKLGMNLTCSLLLCYLKYGSEGFDRKKLGFFETERELVQDARQKLGLKNQRFPLTFLVEACDDIAYCLSDIEDGIEKGLVSFQTVEEFLTKRVVQQDEATTLSTLLAKAKEITPPIYDGSLLQRTIFLQFKIELVRTFIDRAEEAFAVNYDAIMSGAFRTPLLPTGEGTILGELKHFAKENIFSSKEAYDLELLSNSVIKGLLDSFLPLFTLKTETFHKVLGRKTEYGELELEKRLCLMLPKRHVQNYLWQVDEGSHPEPALRAHLFLDYISGMTDTHALEVFQILNGVKATARA